MTKPHKHPVGLWMISTSASFFCVCFGMISSLLALYLSNVLHMKSSDVYSLFAAFFALIFALPVVGGYLGNHFGYKKALILANLLLIAGLLFLAIPTFTFMYLGLAFFASGTAIYTPTYLTLQGKLYEKSDARRDSAYTYSYVVTNVGFLIASVLGGFLQQHFNFQICFLVGAVIGVIPLILFMIWIRTLEFPSESSIAPRSKMGHSGTWLGLILSTALLIPACLWLLYHATLNNVFLIILTIIVALALVLIAFRIQNTRDRYRMGIFIVLSILSIGFWAMYSLEPSLLTLFIANNVDRSIFGFTIPPSVFYGLNPFFIITLGLILGYLWLYLRHRKKDPYLSTKFTLSLFSMTIALMILSLILKLHNPHTLLNPWWIVVVYFFLTLSELLISPIGQSMVGRLAPDGMEGTLMGVWQMFTGVSAALSGFMAQWAVVPNHVTLVESFSIYTSGFFKIALVSLILALVSLVLCPVIKRGMQQK